MNDAETVRASIHETLQATTVRDRDLPEGAMLLGWVAVAEWMAPDGKRWLSVVDGNASGEGCPAWQRQGYLHNALFDPEGFISDGEDDDGDSPDG